MMMSRAMDGLRRLLFSPILIAGAIIITANLPVQRIAAAQDGKDCFSRYTHFNVCEEARKIQAGLAALLPMQMNTNITLSTVMAVGPRIVVTAIWKIKKSEVDTALRASGMSLNSFSARMDGLTRNSVCSEAGMAPFVRLGGQIQYLYKTIDGYVVLSPVVNTC